MMVVVMSGGDGGRDNGGGAYRFSVAEFGQPAQFILGPGLCVDACVLLPKPAHLTVLQ